MQIPDLLKYLIVMNHAPLGLQSHACLTYPHTTPFCQIREVILNYTQASNALRQNSQGLSPMEVDASRKGKSKGRGKGKFKGKTRGTVALINIQFAQQ